MQCPETRCGGGQPGLTAHLPTLSTLQSPAPHPTPTSGHRATTAERSGPEDLMGTHTHTFLPSDTLVWRRKVRTAELLAVSNPISLPPQTSLQSLGIRINLLNVSEHVLFPLYSDTLNNGFCLDYSSKIPKQPGSISFIPIEPRLGGPISAPGVSSPGPALLVMG